MVSGKVVRRMADLGNSIVSVLMGLLVYAILGWALLSPIVLSIRNLRGLFRPDIRYKKRIWLITVILGTGLTSIYNWLVTGTTAFGRTDAYWTEQLIGPQLHQPLCSGHRNVYVIVLVIATLGFLGLLRSRPGKTPPLVTVLEIATLYPAMFFCIVLCIQLKWDVINWIFPLNLVVIACSLIREKILEYDAWLGEDGRSGEAWHQRLLARSKRWPLLALVLALPVLGIILGISILFGLSPDALIRTWTETADWTLSQMQGPPNLEMGEHYLCTVAASGHESIVKPLRMGERRGHRVVVNRQLEVANAFELVLEEKTPRLHKAVRSFYDKYGFPIAKMIRTKASADAVYFLMKPLEWFFLIVLYLTQAYPEDLIAIQYLPGYRKNWQEFKKQKGIC